MTSSHSVLARATLALLVAAALGGCGDAVQNAPTMVTRRAFTRADSAQHGLLTRALGPSGATRDVISGTLCDDAGANCAAFVSASPGFFQGYSQPAPIELGFSGPVGSVTAVGNGAISCDGTWGTLVAYDAAGAEVGRAAMTLRDPADCSPTENPDNVTYGATGTVTASTPIARVVIEPMSLLEFPVFDLVGHASATYSVSFTRIAVTPGFTASCAPNPVERGATVTCEGAVTGFGDYTLQEQRSKGKGFSLSESPGTVYQSGQRFTWSGTAVANAQVKFKVTYDDGTGRVKTDEKAIDLVVTPRGWSPMQLTAAPQLSIQLYPPILEEYNGTLGFFFFFAPDPANGTPPASAQATSGPNSGLWYIAQAIPMPSDIYAYTHPGMYANQTAARGWFNDQNGIGSGTCTQVVLPSLASQAERHEGVTMAANSHYGVANQVYASEKLHEQFEVLYSSRSEAELVKDAGGVFKKFLRTYDRAQAKFDATDRPLIFGSLGCTLDFNPKDS